MYRYFETFGNINHISWRKSKGLSNEVVKPPTTSDNCLAPALSYVGNKTRVKFDGSCLKQDNLHLLMEKQ